jgi:hypothetical protein
MAMMSPEEREQYLAEIGPQIEAAADAVFLRQCGKTYRHAATTPTEKNGHHPDSLARIQSDFPELFGQPGDAT